MGSLSGRSVVITRPAAQAEELATLLRAEGAQVRVRPLVRILPPENPEPLRARLQQLDRYDWIVFTSANAVRACVEAAPPAVKWPPAACVGSATAGFATRAGITVSLVPERFTAEQLAAVWPAGRLRGARIFWPRASGARDALRNTLEEGGATVDDCEAYRTVEDTEAGQRLGAELEREDADALLFTSPSAVRAFRAAGPVATKAAIAVIGTATHAAAARASLAVSVRPEEHTLAALVAALGEYFRTPPSERGA